VRGCGSESGALGLRPGRKERLGEAGIGTCEAETGDQNNELETLTDCPTRGKCGYYACPEGISHCMEVFEQQQPGSPKHIFIAVDTCSSGGIATISSAETGREALI
jgi:hypothetical protein